MIGYIYKLVCSDPTITEFYIGSTKSIRGRKNAHKTDSNNPNCPRYNIPVYKYIRENGGFGNWIMIVIEEHEYEKKFELHSRERYYIEQLKPSLNILIPTRTKKEWVLDNKEMRTEYLKEYKIRNSDKISLQKKEYYKENKERINNRIKNYRQKNKDKISLQKKEYRQKNENKRKKYEKDYYVKNFIKISEKDKIKTECGCGSVFRKRDNSKHIKTKKHKRWQSLYDYIYS